MNKILKNILDLIFGSQETFDQKATAYLNTFKKSYEERNKTENILVECLYNLEFLNSQDRRFLGAAESILVIEGVLRNPGTKFDFKGKENYKEHIIRLSKEFLTERGVI